MQVQKMNTRRITRNTIISAKDEDKQDHEVHKRKRQKSKFDSSDEGSSLDCNPENVSNNEMKEQEDRIKPITNDSKRSKFDTDDEEYSSDDEKEQSTTSLNRKRQIPKIDSDEDGSSSDSSVGDYLKTAEEIDLSSSFFTFDDNEKPPDFDSIEKKMFSGIQQLSDSGESENDDEDQYTNNPEIRIETTTSQNVDSSTNFSQLRNYNKKLEEAKACVKNYEKNKTKENKKKTKVENNQDITHLLSVGETRNRESVDSSQNDFESDDDMDWEEIKENIDKSEEALKIPKEGVQITVEMPSVVRKKSKGVDLMAAIKRRINRIKKENQVYVHKVHLLCWIAHGNFLNSVLNNETLLGQALSLLPSEQCYPPKHADMKYLEQIVRWYGKLMKLQEIPNDNETLIKEQLNEQIIKKQATCKRNFVLLFIIILRSLGLQCRLVLSFQCLPLRPPSSELCSLSTKENNTNEKLKEKSDSKSRKPENAKASTSKESNSKNKSKSSKSKPATVNTSIKNKLNKALNDSIKNKFNQSLNNSKSISKSSDITKIKKSVKFVNEKTTTTDKKETKSNSNKKSSDKIDKDKSPLKLQELEEIKTKNTSERKLSKKLSLKEKLDKNLESDFILVIKNEEKLEKTVKIEPTGTKKAVPSTLKSKSSKKLSLKEKLDKNLEDDTKPPIKDEAKLDGTFKIESNKTKESAPSTSKSKSSKKLSLKEKLDRNVEDDSKLQVKKEVKTKKSPIKISQLDGTDDSPPPKSKTKSSKKTSLSSKLNKNLVELDTDCSKSQRQQRQARNKPVKYVESESTADSDFQPSQGTSSPAKSPTKDINHNKKASTSSAKQTKSKTKLDVRGDIVNLLKGHMAEQRHTDKLKKIRKSSKTNDSDDSDFALEPVKRRISKNKLNSSNEFARNITVNTKVKRRVKPRSEIDRRVLSTDDENSQDDLNKKKKLGNDFWVEVFLEEEEKWISVDLLKGQVHCIAELHNRASHPISYIVAWNNNLSLKDITARYCPNWNTVTRKLRVDSSWWNQSLRPFIGVKNARDKEEDEDLARQQLDKPLPTTISEYKNHPLYALKRHLLKFEAIYPPDAVTLGFVRSEAVYARECVHTLHSREIWVKHAKVVRPGQEPYKIVKARPKYDKLTGNTITDLPLEVYGNWQIEDYVPPTAENGVVPRNAFGNVELFKPCMLPKKTVHLQLPCLNKVARKLRIDCAPAVVGFDFHCGGSHPTFDGYVVCEEFKDVLIDAWEQDQAETAKKELEKYEKRVYGNWRKLIKGLLIRERLKARYDFGAPSTSVKKCKKKAIPSKPKKSRIDSEPEID